MSSTNPKNPVDKFSVYMAAGLIAGCGALMFNVMPVFVGAMYKTFGYGETQLGDLVAFFNIGFTISAVSALAWVRNFNWRNIAGIGVLGSAAGLVIISQLDTFFSQAVLIGVIGLFMGSLYALTLAILGDSNNPDRAFGIKLGLETLPGAVLLFLLPVWIVPAFGFQGVAVGMSMVILALGLFTFLLPKAGVKNKQQEENIVPSIFFRSENLLPLMGLLSSLFFFIGIAATWTFLEILPLSKNLSSEVVGPILAVAFIICGLGGFIAAFIGGRFGPRIPVIGIIFLNGMGLLMLSHFQNAVEYAFGACLFLFSVNFTLAYTFGITAQVDRQGKLVVLSAACLSIGAIIGPMVSGRLVEMFGYDHMLIFSALCSAISLVLYLTLDNYSRKLVPVPG